MHLNVASMVPLLSLLGGRGAANHRLALVVDELLVLVQEPFLQFIVSLRVLGVGLGLP